MRSNEIANTIKEDLQMNKILSIWLNEEFFYHKYLNEGLDFVIELESAKYIGKDSDKMITAKQIKAIADTHNVTVVGDISSVSKMAAIVILKYAYKYPWQKFNVTVVEKNNNK